MNQTQHESPPDVRQLAEQDLPQNPFPGSKQAPFRVFMDPVIRTRIHQHAAEDVSVEICGVLVGRWARDADGPYAQVLESIRGEAAANKFAEVTFTHETWARINQQMDSRFTQMAIVGWYHSHPSFGIFLSDRDRFIQEHFFSGPGQIAYVVDPLRKTEGVFHWREGKPQLCGHYWVGDRIQVCIPAGEEPPAATAKPAPPAPSSQPASVPSKERISWFSFLAPLALGLLLFLLGFVLAGKLTDLERLRIEQGALARSLVYFKIRLGLREDLGRVDADLQAATLAAKALAQEHLKLLQEPKETQTRWTEILRAFERSSQRIGQIEATYALTPREAALLRALTQSPSRPAATDPSEPKDGKSDQQNDDKTKNRKIEDKKE